MLDIRYDTFTTGHTLSYDIHVSVIYSELN